MSATDHSGILLIGGGHAHVAVLADWIKHGLPYESATLLTPFERLRYSGMVPGWIAGQYDQTCGTVDLTVLAQRAGVKLVLDRCVAIDPETRSVLTPNNGMLQFETASIDTGGVGQATTILGSDPRLIDIRPIDSFMARLGSPSPGPKVAVIGGGGAGVELAFALRNAARGLARADVSLVTGSDGLLPSFSASVRRTAHAELRRQDITIIAADARFEGGTLMADGRSLEPLDLIVAALGSGAPDWPRVGGLDCDASHFIAVDAYQRSISHPHIFAIGDVAARQDREVPHSGVHAVMAGPILARNLRSVAKGREPSAIYKPRPSSLYLLSTGNGSAIASYGPLAAQGRWVARLKHWIDNRWISQYANL